MNSEHGSLVPLEEVARTFSVDVVVIERAVALGLVGLPDGRRVVHVEQFDRVAAIVRLHVVLGVELEMVEALLR